MEAPGDHSETDGAGAGATGAGVESTGAEFASAETGCGAGDGACSSILRAITGSATGADSSTGAGLLFTGEIFSALAEGTASSVIGGVDSASSSSGSFFFAGAAFFFFGAAEVLATRRGARFLAGAAACSSSVVLSVGSVIKVWVDGRGWPSESLRCAPEWVLYLNG